MLRGLLTAAMLTPGQRTQCHVPARCIGSTLLRDLLLGPMREGKGREEQLGGGSSSLSLLLTRVLSFLFSSCSPPHLHNNLPYILEPTSSYKHLLDIPAVTLSSTSSWSRGEIAVFAFTPWCVFGSHRPGPSAPATGNLLFVERYYALQYLCMTVGLLQGTST